MKILSDQETVTELLRLMEGNGRDLQAKELVCLISALDSMEQQYSAVLEELRGVKRQLEQVPERRAEQDRTLLVLQAAQEKVGQARDQLAAVKEKIISWAKTTVEDFKRLGVSALDTAISALGIKKLLETMQDKVCGAMESMETSVKRVEAMGQELRNAGTHLKNAGRAAAGKEAQETNTARESRFQATVLAPMRALNTMYAGMNRTIYAALGALDRLDHMAAQSLGKRARPSVRRRLEQKKAEAPALSSSVPGRNPKEAER